MDSFILGLMIAAAPTQANAAAIAPESSAGVQMPLLAGIVPPPGTTIVNMDIAVRAKPKGDPAIYELKSPLSAQNFKAGYAKSAAQAGFKVSMTGNLVVGVRQDGTSIRLRVLTSNIGSAGVLTIKGSTNESA